MEDDVKIVLRERGYEVADWINMTQRKKRWSPLVNTAVDLRFRKEADSSWVLQSILNYDL